MYTDFQTEYLYEILCLDVLVTGDATWYHLNGGITACGERFTDQDLVAATAFNYWTHPNPNLDPMCQRRARVTDPTSGRQVVVRIKDKCGGCRSGDIDLSPAAFRQLRDLGVGRFRVNWDFI